MTEQLLGAGDECLAVSPHGFLCTREEDHGGTWHIAKSDEVRDGKHVVIDRWSIDFGYSVTT